MSGWVKNIIKAGTGARVKSGDNVTVHCTGYGKNRDPTVVFWSTKDAGQKPFTFQIGLKQVIPAWDEGVLTMSVGEVAMIDAEASAAYGAGGFPAWGIMPNSPLRFEIEVLSVN